jgi:non-ribosomal peptide synthetase component E (peptide arylation enzyme)
MLKMSFVIPYNSHVSTFDDYLISFNISHSVLHCYLTIREVFLLLSPLVHNYDIVYFQQLHALMLFVHK